MFQEGSSFTYYGNNLIHKYKKDYLSSIFENQTVREDFTRFVNSHLTPEVKSDLKAVRIYKTIGGQDMPVVNFSADMDGWLGVLPQWKRLKFFFFMQMEAYVDSHPDILQHARTATTPPLFFHRRTPNSPIK